MNRDILLSLRDQLGTRLHRVDARASVGIGKRDGEYVLVVLAESGAADLPFPERFHGIRVIAQDIGSIEGYSVDHRGDDYVE